MNSRFSSAWPATHEVKKEFLESSLHIQTMPVAVPSDKVRAASLAFRASAVWRLVLTEFGALVARLSLVIGRFVAWRLLYE
jgi:hypothetical protein